MKTKILFIVAIGVYGLLFGVLPAFSQGGLTPPGAPAPTMKTLDQIYSQLEPRIAITTTGGVLITQPGSYYLATNINTLPSYDPVAITTNDVTLDLNGFTIKGATTPAGSGIAIYLFPGISNITIMNGFIASGVTVTNGTFSGTGFAYGIYSPSVNPPRHVRVSHVIASGFLVYGIYLGHNDTVVESCIVDTAGDTGINAQSVTDSTAINCGTGYGINASQIVNNCVASSVSSGDGIDGTIVNNSYGVSSSGNGIFGAEVSHCYGSSESGTGIFADTIAESSSGETAGTSDGLFGAVALNCYGYSANGNGVEGTSVVGCIGGTFTGNGISVVSAENCYGYSTSSGVGLSAQTEANQGTASGCTGTSVGGTGLVTANATGCNGTSTNGTGLSANTATGCSGVSITGTGLSAGTAHNCNGVSASGSGLNAENAENCIGSCTGGGSGITSTIATGCTGTSISGFGIFTSQALNCYGSTSTGLYGIYSHVANCSYGSASAKNSIGLLADEVATGCYGICNPGTGLKAGIANSCGGTGTTRLVVSSPYNMPYP